MATFKFVLLYVKSPASSAAFYSDLLAIPTIEASPTFAMLPLNEGVMLGLWAQHTVAPAPPGRAGASEIALTVADADAVRIKHQDWTKRGVKMAQAPTQMDFGHTFVALDPDGHRIRVLAPEGP